MILHPDLTDTLYSEELFLIPQKTALVFDVEWNELSEDEKELLKGILKAIQLNTDMVTVHFQPQLNLPQLPIKTSHCIYFAQPTAGQTAYEVVETNGTKLLISDRLSHLLTHGESKKNLWLALQKQFRK